MSTQGIAFHYTVELLSPADILLHNFDTWEIFTLIMTLIGPFKKFYLAKSSAYNHGAIQIYLKC